MKQLRIQSISELHFGKYHGSAFKDLDHDFVVFYGLNESGKSTIAEYLTWAIGGTWRKGTGVNLRFKTSTSDQVTGRLVGALGDETLDIDAKFKIQQTGVAKDLRSGTIGSRQIDNTKLKELFENIEPEDFQWIYRLYGVEIGNVDATKDIPDLFSQYITGNPQVNGNPRDRAKDLTDQAKKQLDAKQKLLDQQKDLKSQIREAENAPEVMSLLYAELTKIQEDLVTSETKTLHIQKQKELVVQAQKGSDALTRRTESQTHLRLLGTVPTAWERIVLIAEDIRRVQGEISSIESQLIPAKSEAERCASIVSLPSDSLMGQTLTPAERLQIQNASAAVNDIDSKLSTLNDAIAKIDKEISVVTNEISDCASLVGVASPNFDNVGHPSRFTDLQGSVALWERAAKDVSEIEDSLAGAQAQLKEVMSQKNPTDTSVGPKINPLLLIASLIFVGGLSLIHPIASIVGAVVCALGLAILTKKGIVTVPATTDQAVRIRNSQDQVAHLQAQLANAKSECERAESQVLNPLKVLGAVYLTAETAKSFLTQLTELATKLVTRKNLSDQLESTRNDVNKLTPLLEKATSEFASLLKSRHIAQIPESGVFDSWLINYEDAIKASHHLSELSERYLSLQSKFTELVSPIASEINGLSWALVDSKLKEYVQLYSDVHSAERTLREVEIEVATAGMDTPEMRELIEKYSSSESLITLHSKLVTELEDLGFGRDRIIERRTEINQEIKDRESREILPSLLLKLGETEESIEETTTSQAALAIASSLISQVINSFEVEHQGPIIKESQALISRVVPDWGSVMYTRDADKVIIERDGIGGRLRADSLSDGGRALLYLGMRLAFAKTDAKERKIFFPLICDDPFIHFDDERTSAAMKLFGDIAKEHQVIMFTCETSTRDLARDHGAKIIELPSH